MARVVDRVRDLEKLHPAASGPERDRYVWELRILDRRIKIINAGLFLAVSSAVMTCLVVAQLFIAELIGLRIATMVALSFTAAMILLIAALVCFTIEVRTSLRAVTVREELLQRP
jgi:ABC-type cobalamin transport system permease subunit